MPCGVSPGPVLVSIATIGYGMNNSNDRFEPAAPDLRPAVAFDQVEDATINGMSAQGDKSAASLLRFTDSRDILLSASRVRNPVTVFLRVEGSASQGLTVDGGDLSKAAKGVELVSGGFGKATDVTVEI